MMMQSISWITFGLSNTLAKTIVHFFPSSGNVSAPYPVFCKLTLFGGGVIGKSVTLEGPRLSHPDGVKLHEVFPNGMETRGGLVGLDVAITTSQPRIDVSASMCIMELASKAYSARFRPLFLGGRGIAHRTLQKKENSEPVPVIAQPALALNDMYNVSSLILVNGSSATVTPKLATVAPLQKVAGGDFEMQSELIEVQPLPAYSLYEVPLEGSFYSGSNPTECSWGQCTARNLVSLEPLPYGVAYFMMYRDTSTHMPVSVCAL